MTYAAWQGIELGLAELYIVLTYGNNSIPFGSHSLTPGELAHGHAIMVVGACALYCGMKHCQPRQTLSGRRATLGTSWWVLGAAFFIGGAIHLFQEVLEPVLGTIVAQLNAIPLAALCLLAVDARGYSPLSERTLLHAAHGVPGSGRAEQPP